MARALKNGKQEAQGVNLASIIERIIVSLLDQSLCSAISSSLCIGISSMINQEREVW